MRYSLPKFNKKANLLVITLIFTTFLLGLSVSLISKTSYITNTQREINTGNILEENFKSIVGNLNDSNRSDPEFGFRNLNDLILIEESGLIIKRTKAEIEPVIENIEGTDTLTGFDASGEYLNCVDLKCSKVVKTLNIESITP